MPVGKIFTGGIDMARPKKANTEQLLQLLNTYYEIDGNPEKLKFSMLEKYAKTMGYEIKAYEQPGNGCGSHCYEIILGVRFPFAFIKFEFSSDINHNISKAYVEHAVKKRFDVCKYFCSKKQWQQL